MSSSSAGLQELKAKAVAIKNESANIAIKDNNNVTDYIPTSDYPADATLEERNVEDALYSGKLNKGVTKRGSVIFEESKKAEQMRLSYYDVTIDQNKEETIDYNKRIFSVNIEMPKDVNKESNKK